jgi:hypothetical protein
LGAGLRVAGFGLEAAGLGFLEEEGLVFNRQSVRSFKPGQKADEDQPPGS